MSRSDARAENDSVQISHLSPKEKRYRAFFTGSAAPPDSPDFDCSAVEPLKYEEIGVPKYRGTTRKQRMQMTRVKKMAN